MKVKNLVLFGFILSAISYLSKQIEEEQEDETNFLSELEDIDLQQVKNELGSKLEKAIVEFGDVVGSITKIGSDAFDRFLKDATDDLQEGELVEKLKEAIVSKEVEEEPEKVEEIGEVDKVEVEATDDIDEVLEVSTNDFEDLLEVIEETVEEESEDTTEDLDEATEEEFSDESDDSLEEANFEEFDKTEEASETPSECEEVSEEIEAQEEPQIAEEVQEDSMWNQPEVNADELLKDLKNTLDSFFARSEESEQANVEEEMFEEIKKATEQPEEQKEIEDLFEELLVDTKAKVEKEVNKDEIDAILNEIIEQENIEEAEEPAKAEETVDEENVFETEETENEENAQEYVRDLIEELPQEEEVEYEEDIYDQINKLYPYLSKTFVRSVFDLKEVIAKEYPQDIDVLVLHRVSFENVLDIQQFVEIVTNHKYSVNVDERKMIVDLFKVYRNTDGKILTNIFEIANQARLLHGEYEGYRVEVKE